MTEQPQTPESAADAAGETPAPIEPTGATTSQPLETGSAPQPAPGQPAPAAAPSPPPPPPPPPGSAPHGVGASTAADRPEVAIGAAFAGGFLFAMMLRRLAR